MSKIKMNAVLPFLERNVQWFTIVIAAVYVVLMAYLYIVTPPLTVSIGPAAHPQVLLPGTVDPVIVKDVVEPLKKEFLDPTNDKPALLNQVTELKPIIELDPKLINLDPKLTEVAALRAPFHAPHILTGSFNNNQLDQNQGNGKLVDSMPAPPIGMPDGFTEGWTVILTGNPPTARSDLGYITLRFMPDWRAYQQQLADKLGQNGALAPELLKPQFAEVVLLREQRKSDGSWSSPQVVPGLPINILPEFLKENVLNKPKENLKTIMTYRDSTSDPVHQELLINPPFYPTATDSPMHVNPQGQAPPAAGAVAAPGDGAAAAVSGAVGPAPIPAPAPAAGVPAPETATAAAPGAAAGAGVAAAGLAPFNSPIICHDTTVQEGKTYRYAVRYRLVNPVFGTSKVATDKLTLQFTLDSPDPAAAPDATDQKNPVWTNGIALDPSVRVFVTKIIVSGGGAQFDVFEWKNGRWSRSATPIVMPGDPISTAKGVPSHWTLVDVRNDPRKRAGVLVPYIMLMDTNGTLYSHDKASDEADPIYTKLKSETEATATVIGPR